MILDRHRRLLLDPAALFGRAKSPVSVLTRSGISLEVAFERAGDGVTNVRLKGDARLIYRASVTPETLDARSSVFTSMSSVAVALTEIVPPA